MICIKAQEAFAPSHMSLHFILRTESTNRAFFTNEGRGAVCFNFRDALRFQRTMLMLLELIDNASED